MERETGIEPATSSLGSWRSTAELLPLEAQQSHDSTSVVSLVTSAKARSRRNSLPYRTDSDQHLCEFSADMEPQPISSTPGTGIALVSL